MNKYNVRAIRNELDGYMRHSKWKAFRARFSTLSNELQQAVVEHRPPNNNRHNPKNSGKSLLHNLCHSVNAHPPVPIDLLETVIQSCPHLLHSQLFPTATPLSIALDRQASPAVVECLLLHDDTDTSKKSLYIQDGNKGGDTPILQAIKQEASDDIIKLLIQHDTASKASLLIPSKKRHRVPLFHVANQELYHANLEFEGEIPEELEYMLLQTYHALEIQQGRRSVRAGDNDDIDEENDTHDVEDEGFFHQSGNQFDASSRDDDEYWLSRLHATIACAHFMGDKNTDKLLSFLLARIDDDDNHNHNTVEELAVDAHDHDNLFHHVCRATQLFSEPMMETGGSLLEYLIHRHHDAELALVTPNAQGQLPLHVALTTKKPWDAFLQVLLDGTTMGLERMATSQGQLPLHLAIQHYPSQAKEIHELWSRYPDATTVVNDKERLVPFQLAAVVKGKSQSKSKSEPKQKKSDSSNSNRHKHNKERLSTTDAQPETKDLDQLSDIFFFLRASPQVLREFA
jgi:hypothetical protein